jgi:hypothetical protein
MSLLDQVRKLEQEVVDRLKELEPLTREYEQLRKVADRLGLKYSPGTAETDRKAKLSPGRGARAGAGKRAARKPARTRVRASAARARAARPAAKPRETRSSTGQRPAGATKTTGAGKTTAPSRKRKGGQRSSGRRASARPGQRHDDVLRLVGESPGITVREIGERLGVDATGLYRVVNRLTDEGRMRKDGPRLHPVDSAATSSAAAEAATGPESSTSAADSGSSGDS